MDVKTIYKYRLKIQDVQLIGLPDRAEILSAGLDPSGHLCLWAKHEVDETGQGTNTPRVVYIVGTGHPLNSENEKDMAFLASVTQGQFVWHIFVDAI